MPAARGGRSRTRSSRSWWPPGGERCTVTDGGIAVATKTTFPWREYVTVVLFALAVAVLRLRPLRMLASFAFFLAGFVVFFGFFPLAVVPEEVV